jgi:hypothetical protein
MTETKILIPGDAKREYKSTDPNLIHALMALEHKPVRIECNGNILSYIFDSEKIEPDLNQIMTNEDMQVSLRSVWSAQQVWSMNLHRARRDQ